MSAYRGDRANGLGAPALIEYNTNTSPKTPQRLVGPMGVGRPLGKCARGGQEPTVSAALFGINWPISADCLSLLKFPGFRCDFGKPIGKAVEETPVGSLRKRATEHFQDMLGDVQRIEQTDSVRLANRGGEPWCGHKVTGLGEIGRASWRGRG